MTKSVLYSGKNTTGAHRAMWAGTTHAARISAMYTIDIPSRRAILRCVHHVLLGELRDPAFRLRGWGWCAFIAEGTGRWFPTRLEPGGVCKGRRSTRLPSFVSTQNWRASSKARNWVANPGDLYGSRGSMPRPSFDRYREWSQTRFERAGSERTGFDYSTYRFGKRAATAHNLVGSQGDLHGSPSSILGLTV